VLEPRTEAGRAGLRALTSDPLSVLLALDYDGTLAPIVDEPSKAAPAPGAVAALAALSALVGQVAVITGRAADVAVALGGLDRVPQLVVLGQYGAQRWHGGAVTAWPPDPGLEPARHALAALDLPAGVLVEDKGLSLSVHTRRAADPVAALTRLHPLLSQVAADTGLAAHLGRMVVELRPAGFDKGRALTDLAGSFKTVAFAGDDIGDIAAFDAVDELRSRGTAGLLICSDSTEGPGLLRDRADVVVPGPAGVVQLLEGLVSLLDPR